MAMGRRLNRHGRIVDLGKRRGSGHVGKAPYPAPEPRCAEGPMTDRPLDVARLLAYAIPKAKDDYGPRDAILYSLGVGAGLCADIDETSYLFEQDLQVLPTMASPRSCPRSNPLQMHRFDRTFYRCTITSPAFSRGSRRRDLPISDLCEPRNARNCVSTIVSPGA